ncbi:MAG: sigma-70 family RNA polymerase sigma factor [Oscillospiraceae bacterium]|nr:sigma-70 family RNA polymerase sigma factor [Oscillospiraceae bacterium]
MTESQIRSLMQFQPEQGEKALYETYYRYVYAIAFRIIHPVGTHEDVEECVIDVFLEIFRHFAAIREGSLKTYIGMTAKNRAVNAHHSILARAKRTEPLDENEAADLPAALDVAETAEQKELTQRLLQSIKALGEPDSVILIQKYFFDRNASEISRIIGKSPAYVRIRCSRALKRLRPVLEDLK